MAPAGLFPIGLVGCGTVGTGVVRILQSSADLLAAQAGQSLTLRHVVVRDLTRARDVDLSGCAVSDSLEALIADPSVQAVVHVVGGVEGPRQDIVRLLQSGKDVITANKALLCAHGDELFELARSLGRTIGFEAAVAGGIPIISTVCTALTANRILAIEAILNGTSNFILTRMLDRRQIYDDVLREAQQLGYAEADPAMDVDGTDAAQKLAILAKLAFGTAIPFDRIARQGIQNIDLQDLLAAADLGYRIKLLAVARLMTERLEVSVQPTLVRADRSIAMTSGAHNFIAIEGDAVGVLKLAGAGAGRMPTASAVVADLVDCVTGRAACTFQALLRLQQRNPLPLHPSADIARRQYLRFNVADRPHVLADIAHVLGRHGISISSVRQDETEDSVDGTGVARLVILTHRAAEGRLQAADNEIDCLDSLRGPRIRMPIAD
ncbi:MAG: homoserine dehydrogenase [Planctomyces sp.]|jgi:homoserine dehydrogenase|nr:homoserine dehydrogenase [Planctomycetaceae bacterium]